jgi:hypothetical protein
MKLGIASALTEQAIVEAVKNKMVDLLLQVYPELWLDEMQRYEVLGEFMEYIAGNELMLKSPAVFVAYLDVLTSLATGENGAQVWIPWVRCRVSRHLLLQELSIGTTYAYLVHLVSFCNAAGHVHAAEDWKHV